MKILQNDNLMRGVTGVAAFGMLALGGYEISEDKVAAASVALGFGFLLVVIYFLGKFRRFKGFGFEAETWEEKQQEAAALIDRLRSFALVTAGHLARLSSQVGEFNLDSQTRKIAQQMAELKALLLQMGASRDDCDQAVLPFLNRVIRDIHREGIHIVYQAIEAAAAQKNLEASKLKDDERGRAIDQERQIIEFRRQFDDRYRRSEYSEDVTIDALIAQVRGAGFFIDKDAIIRELTGLKFRLSAFQATGKLL